MPILMKLACFGWHEASHHPLSENTPTLSALERRPVHPRLDYMHQFHRRLAPRDQPDCDALFGLSCEAQLEDPRAAALQFAALPAAAPRLFLVPLQADPSA